MVIASRIATYVTMIHSTIEIAENEAPYTIALFLGKDFFNAIQSDKANGPIKAPIPESRTKTRASMPVSLHSTAKTSTHAQTVATENTQH